MTRTASLIAAFIVCVMVASAIAGVVTSGLVGQLVTKLAVIR